MECPKCKFDHPDQTTECLKCGIVFAKCLSVQDAPEAPVPPQETIKDEADYTREEARDEFRYRLFAIPASLLGTRIFLGSVPWMVRLLTMWVHETGHAVTAWFCGFWAMPGPWFTPVSDERTLGITLFVVAALGFGGFLCWKTERWFLFGVVGALFVFKIVCTLLPIHRAQALIIFGGDGGCMVLGTILMATFYMRREGAIYQNGLRWGFIVIGAAALLDPFKTWTGPEDDLPFGVQEGTLSDPSQMVQNYGWTIQFMIQQYVRLGLLCFALVAAFYVFGIVQARAVSRSRGL
jgi:hypothetical protein